MRLICIVHVTYSKNAAETKNTKKNFKYAKITVAHKNVLRKLT